MSFPNRLSARPSPGAPRVVAAVLATALFGAGAGAAASMSTTSTTAQAELEADLVAQPTGADWSRYDATCGAPELLHCGDVGRFRLGQAAPAPPCTPLASGTATLHPYPRRVPAGGTPFPHIVELFEPVETVVQTVFGLGGGLLDGGDEDWIAVVDFDDEHGWSTTFLADTVAGPAIEARLVPLDAEDSDPFGTTVNDFHVLRALCGVLDAVATGAEPAPLSVNMSFGRVKGPDEAWYAGTCDAPPFACQIARVVAALEDRGSHVLAAAGNHDEMLFPAGLPDVTAAGALDLHSAFGDGTPTATWEAPDGSDVLAPAGHLCLDDVWSTPSGSSYASAFAAGWFASDPQIAPDGGDGAGGGEGPDWVPTRDDDAGCWVLEGPAGQRSACNLAVDLYFATLDGTLPNPCWIPSAVPGPDVQMPGRGDAPPDLPGFDHWAEAIHPTPSGDPCVPCTGQLSGGGTPDLDLDLSDSPGLDPAVHIVEVHVKTLDGYQPVPLTGEQLEDLRAGTLGQLDLSGYDLGLQYGLQPSLWYLISDQPNPDCEGGDFCFWDASSILVQGGH